jgi:predicted amino acid dehydrogenase
MVTFSSASHLPNRPKPAIFLFLYNCVTMSWGSITNLAKASSRIPQEYAGYAARIDKRVSTVGPKRVALDLWSIVPKLLSTSRDLAVYLLPRFHFVTPGRFAFLVHPRDMEDVYRVFPFARYLPTPLVMEILKYLPPINLSTMTGLALLGRGDPIDGYLLATMITPDHMTADKRFAARSATGLTLFAQKLGVTFAGLGALFPSLKRYGTIPRTFGTRLGITTGHAFTSLSIANIALKVRNLVSPIMHETELIAIVGAAGSTGSATAKILAQKGHLSLLLLDRTEKEAYLSTLKTEIETLNPTCTVEIGTDNGLIRRARIIVTVTNASTAMIQEEWIKPGMIFIDDAQPPNVDEAIARRRLDIAVIKVLAKMPDLDPHFDFGLGTPPNITFTCLLEAATLAAHGWTDDFTIGRPTPSQVARIEELAKDLQVVLPSSFYGYAGISYTEAEIQRIAHLFASD